MNINQESNSKIEVAVYRLRALRALPTTEGTERAQRKILNRLNLDETTEVAVRLSALEQQDQAAKQRATVNTPAPQDEVSRG
jgi:hypothetical protein